MSELWTHPSILAANLLDHQSVIREQRAEIARLTAELQGIGVEEFYTVREEARRLTAENARLREAGAKCLNYIANTESELGINLSCGDAMRAALNERGQGG